MEERPPSLHDRATAHKHEKMVANDGGPFREAHGGVVEESEVEPRPKSSLLPSTDDKFTDGEVTIYGVESRKQAGDSKVM